MQPVIDKFIEDVKLKLLEANERYGVNLVFGKNTFIRCDVRGKTAGWAITRKGIHTLRFNAEAILNYNQDMTANTIPHEVAHLVCHERRDLGYKHDAGWKRVCRQLGGDDARTHDYVLTPTRAPVKFDYILDSGREVEIGPKHHANIQGGRTDYFMRNPKEFIRADQWVDYDETAPKVVPVPQLPGLNIVRSNVPAVAAHASKSVKARAIYNANLHLQRKDVIDLFVAHAGLTKAGAATYYQNFKSGK